MKIRHPINFALGCGLLLLLIFDIVFEADAVAIVFVGFASIYNLCVAFWDDGYHGRL